MVVAPRMEQDVQSNLQEFSTRSEVETASASRVTGGAHGEYYINDQKYVLDDG